VGGGDRKLVVLVISVKPMMFKKTNKMRTRSLALLIGALFAAPAFAGPSDAWHLFAGVGYGHDDNLLRVPDNQPAFDNTRADSWTQGDAGFLFDNIYSRQHINLVAKVSNVKFNHFKQLDYQGKDLQATWFWQLGNHLDGQAGYTYNKVLAPYTDFYSNQRNLRIQRRSFFDGGWQMHPDWRARVAYAKDAYSYELSSQRFNNRTEDTTELEGDYTPSSGSTVGLVLRRIQGSYPFGRPIGPFVVNNDFTQDELKARVNWLMTGSTTLQALVGYARRDQPSFSDSSTGGANGRVTLLYAPRGKISYNVSAWRDFAALESTLVSYTLNKGVSAGAVWDATAKVKIEANASYERRNYSARTAVSNADNLRDSLRTGSLRATWTVRPAIQLAAAFVHQSRTGSVTLGTGSFTSNMVTLNASAQF
jgi:exopolysaccharide biosynthesis operon protein EpsL